VALAALDAARVCANVESVRERIAAAVRRAGRDPAGVELLAAVKYVAAGQLGTLRDAGLTLVGENRLQELARKQDAHPELTWDFIGALQSRKVRDLLARVRLIHSVASDSALAQLARHGDAQRTEVLVEVNLSGEAAKAGVPPGQLAGFVKRCPVRVGGLMTMPPLAVTPEASRPYFARLARLAAELGLARLSMGTSQDFEVAIEEGATIVRIGSILYD
jgi:pyridoxal phosphate enzyme (YggS family)